MNNQQTTTHTTEAPEQPMLPGIEEAAAQAETQPVGRVSDEGDLAAENAQLRDKIHMLTAVYDIKTRLARAGAKSPSWVTDKVKDQFEFSEEGELINAEAVIEYAKATHPA